MYIRRTCISRHPIISLVVSSTMPRFTRNISRGLYIIFPFKQWSGFTPWRTQWIRIYPSYIIIIITYEHSTARVRVIWRPRSRNRLSLSEILPLAYMCVCSCVFASVYAYVCVYVKSDKTVVHYTIRNIIIIHENVDFISDKSFQTSVCVCFTPMPYKADAKYRPRFRCA